MCRYCAKHLSSIYSIHLFFASVSSIYCVSHTSKNKHNYFHWADEKTGISIWIYSSCS